MMTFFQHFNSNFNAPPSSFINLPKSPIVDLFTDLYFFKFDFKRGLQGSILLEFGFELS